MVTETLRHELHYGSVPYFPAQKNYAFHADLFCALYLTKQQSSHQKILRALFFGHSNNPAPDLAANLRISLNIARSPVTGSHQSKQSG